MRHKMARLPWGVNVYYDPLEQMDFYAQVRQGRQVLDFQAKVGEQSAQLLLDASITNKSFISTANCRRLGIPIWNLFSAQMQAQVPRTTSVSVDPTEFSALPCDYPSPRVDSDSRTHMMTPVTCGIGIQASPTGIATFILHCRGFWTKVTCPVLDLADELDVVLGHE